jgi:hypothetical protein
MSERDDPRPSALRAVESPRQQSTETDTTLAARSALDVIDHRLHAVSGFDGILDWLRKTERIVAATSDAELARTRRDIRELIDRLLEVNANVQTIARLKRIVG